MINGAHIVVYSRDAEADRQFFRDVLGFSSVDAGHGWLIFGLPPSEVAVHPAETGGTHELFLMCDDIQSEIANLDAKQVPHTGVDEQRWGSIIRVTLPGGGQIGVYQPKHPGRRHDGTGRHRGTRYMTAVTVLRAADCGPVARHRQGYAVGTGRAVFGVMASATPRDF